jgi:hypothetical protein
MMKVSHIFCLLVATLLCRVAFAAEQDADIHVCYIQNQRLFDERISGLQKGQTAEGPRLLCKLTQPPFVGARIKILGRDPHLDTIYFLCYADVWRESNGSLRKVLTDAPGAALSPSGKEVSFPSAGDLWIANMATGPLRRICANGVSPFWSARSNKLACILDVPGSDAEGPGVLVNLVSGKIIFKTTAAVNPIGPFLSPDGRYLAIQFHMSNPVTGDSIFDTSKEISQSQQDVSKYTPKSYLPAVIEDWSLDGKWILWDWRIPDPNNDGKWLRDDIGLTNRDAKVRRLIGTGIDARFSPGAAYLFFLRTYHGTNGIHDLYIKRFAGGHEQLIARDVDNYYTY